jgi:hypothetical protein
VSNVEEIQKGMLAHAQWKERIKNAIETGASNFTADQVKIDDGCDFGAWLHALPDQTSDEWKQIHRLHEQFHEEAGRILDLALQGRKDEAKQAISLNSHFADLSVRMTNLLIAWKKKV